MIRMDGYILTQIITNITYKTGTTLYLQWILCHNIYTEINVNLLQL